MISDKPLAGPSKSRSNKVPHPAGITEPVNENPRTVEPPADIVNPAASASPPPADKTEAPSTSN